MSEDIMGESMTAGPSISRSNSDPSMASQPPGSSSSCDTLVSDSWYETHTETSVSPEQETVESESNVSASPSTNNEDSPLSHDGSVKSGKELIYGFCKRFSQTLRHVQLDATLRYYYNSDSNGYPQRLQTVINNGIEVAHCRFPSELRHNGIIYMIEGLVRKDITGVVVAARTPGDKWYAIKITCKVSQYSKEGGREQLLREKDAMIEADAHDLRFIAQLCASWDDEEHVYFVMPLCITSQDKFLWRWFHSFDLELVKILIFRWSLSLVISMEELWSLGYTPCTLSMEGFLIDRQCIPILSDLRFVTPCDIESKFFMAHNPYRILTAPEFHSASPNPTKKSDIWALGLMLLMLQLHLNPSLFDDTSEGGNLHPSAERHDLDSLLEDLVYDPIARDLISKMLKIDPEERLTMEEIKGHPYFVHSLHFELCKAHRQRIFYHQVGPANGYDQQGQKKSTEIARYMTSSQRHFLGGLCHRLVRRDTHKY